MRSRPTHRRGSSSSRAQLRERTGMKQADLARRVTWSQAVLSRIEGGERNVSDDELKTLLGAIGTTDALELAAILERAWRLPPQPALDHPDQHLLWEAEQLAADLDALSAAPEVRQPFRQRVTEYVDEVRRLAQLILRREHQIAFIGSIGIGKSTAISRAADLEIAGQQGARCRCWTPARAASRCARS